MKAKLRVAIAGAGMIANAGHIPAWRNLDAEVEVIAIYNHHMQKAQNTAKRHGIEHAYDDWSKLLSEQQPDVVSICTPNTTHEWYTIAALEAGAHVLCEKPIAASYAAASRMFEKAKQVGRVLFVGQTGRFSSKAMAAKAIVDAGQLGEIYYAETSALRRRGVPKWGRFHIKADSGGGALIDIGVHALDLLLWLMGNPRVVAASGLTYTKLADHDEGLVTSLADSGAPIGVFDPRPYDTAEFDVEDMAVGLLRLETGAAIAIKASWAANVPPSTGGTILIGTEGGLGMQPLTLVRNMGGYQVDVTPKVPADPDVPFYGHWRETEHLVRVLRGDQDPIVRPEEVLNVIRALEGLYRSAESGGEIALYE
jgi:predicted dehydrogenase